MVPQKVDPAISVSGIHLKEWKAGTQNRYLYANLHFGIIQDS